MSKEYSTDKVTRHKQIAIEKLDTFLNDCIENDLPKADKLSYWISDYAGYLKSEKTFLPGKLKRYKRGDIVKVNFGFRLGSELGGRHYCVVLDKDNSPKAPTITVMPLTSLKENTDINKLPKDRIYLGSEIYTEVLKKANKVLESLSNDYKDIMTRYKNNSISFEAFSSFEAKNKARITLAHNIIKEIESMKGGSIALAGQITTISKLRISDPKHFHDVLSNIRISADTLNLIDNKICELFVHNTQWLSK